MEHYLSALTGFVKNRHFYTVDLDTWFFLDYDLETLEYKIISDLSPNERGMNWIRKIMNINGEYWFLQRNNKELLCLTENGHIARYGTEYKREDDIWKLVYKDTCLIDNCLYLLPYRTSGCISVFDLNRKEYIIEESFSELLSDSDIDGLLSYIHSEEDRSVRFAVEGSDHSGVLRFDDMRVAEEERLSEKVSWIHGGFYDYYYTLSDPSGGCLVEGKVIDPENRRHTEPRKELNICWFSHKNRDHIYMIANDDSGLESISLKEELYSGTIAFPKEALPIFERRGSSLRFADYAEDNGVYYFIPFSSNGMVSWDSHTNETKYYPLTIAQNDIERKKAVLLKEELKNRTVIENSWSDLGIFLRSVVD